MGLLGKTESVDTKGKLDNMVDYGRARVRKDEDRGRTDAQVEEGRIFPIVIDGKDSC